MRCTLCPRRCGALRTASAGSGFCRMPSLPVVARAMLHHWEEPCISGTNGSGAVFFSGCVLGCVFCQNGPISRERFGKAISVPRLRGIFEALIAQGAHNINLVSPTPFVPPILEALAEPLPVPVVWNTGGYERTETLRALEGALGDRLLHRETLAAETGLEPEEIAAAETANAPVSSLQMDLGDGLTLEQLMGDEGMEEGVLEKLALREAISALPEREQQVVALRYFRGLTQDKTSKILGVSQVQVSRIERKAVSRLRELLE